MALINFGKDKNSSKAYGRFIVIDGIDGSGKSTQLDLLKQELEIAGYKTETIHFPQHGQYSAAMVDAYLAGNFGQLNGYAASVFFAIDRFEAAGKIRQWLKEGKVVLSDRYVSSNAAHQGGKLAEHLERVKFFRWLDNLEFVVFNIPRPDLTLILDVPAEAAVQMLKQRTEDPGHTDRMHETDKQHLAASHQVYLEIAKLFPNTKLIECVKGDELLLPDQIHNKVWELVRRIALKDFKI